MRERFKSLSRGKRWLVIIGLIVFFFVAFVVLPAAAWLVGTRTIAGTSNSAFCGGCHTMQPFAKAYADSAHGGDNHMGIVAECTACHLPHDTPWDYLVAKTKRGTYDIWAETFHDTSTIDWKEKSGHSEEFVYDSGCLTCHVELEKATSGARQHDNYFAGVTDSKCVTCHDHVGHSNINQYLLEHKYRP
ncbi:MAG: NapC/NirT family cytochrome c [Actinomycetota bacterium]